MSALHHRIGRAALLLAAGVSLSVAHAPAFAASQDLSFVAAVCVPDGPETVDFGFTSASGGFLRAGRDIYDRIYVCPVGNPDNLTARPSWTHLLLQCLNPNTGRSGGSVVARLNRKSRSTGTASQVVALECPSSTSTVRTFAVPLGVRLDFSQFAYWVTLELKSSAVPVEAHMVAMTTR